MGASGHVLGLRKLAWLSRKTGLDVAHALRGYGSNDYDVRVRTDECRHYRIDPKTFAVLSGPDPCTRSFTSCNDWYKAKGGESEER